MLRNRTPDYAARVSKNANTNYTAEFDGVLFLFGKLTSGTKYLTINGVVFPFLAAHGDGSACNGCFYPLNYGDTFRADNTDNFEMYLIPYRG